MRTIATTKDALALFLEASTVFAEMEHNGMRIDVPRLHRSIDEVSARIKELEEQMRRDPVHTAWKKRYKDRMKLGSREQLGHVLFDDLGLSYTGERTEKKQNYKIDEHTLSKIDLPFVRWFLSVEELKKLRAVNLYGIKNELVGEFLHPTFHLNLVKSFRSSSSGINFQNLPNRDPELAKIVRSCFIPRDGFVLLEGDFKSIEVCMAACNTMDPNLIAYVSDPTKDMHRDSAMKLFLLTKAQVTKAIRYAAKSFFVFAQFYGDYYIHCANLLWEAADTLTLADGTPLKDHLASKGITELGDLDPRSRPRPGTFEEHVQSVERWLWTEMFPVYAQWKIDNWENYKRAGFITNKTGFRFEGEFTKNQINNIPNQSCGFHCLAATQIRLLRWLKKYKKKSLLIGQVHDSSNKDAHKQEWQDVAHEMVRIVKEDLPKLWPWIVVPLGVEIEMAETTWFDKKEVKL